MKRFCALAGVILPIFLFFFTVPATGQGQIENEYYYPESSLVLGDIAANPELSDAFDKWVNSVTAGDEMGAFDEATRIREIMRRLGTRNLLSLADMALAVGRKLLSGGKTKQAVMAGQHAILFAPDDPGAHFFLANALFSHNRMDVNNVATEVIAGTKALLYDKIQRDRFISIATRYAILALLLAFMLTFLAFAALHYRALLSDIADILPTRPEGAWKAALGALVLLVPLAVGGWFLFLLAIPLFLLPYLRLRGKAVVALFALFIFSGPYVFEYMAKSVTLANADTYRALYLLSKNTWDYETKKALERENEANPDDTLVSFALGLLNKLRKDKTAAIMYYDAVLRKDPSNLRALVNKGNSYFIAKDYDNAVEMYKKALKVDPQSVEAHFNLSNTYAFMAKTKDSESEYNMALSIDLDRTRRLVEMAGDSHESKVVDFPITKKDLEMYEAAVAQDTRAVAKVLWNVYFGAISVNVYRWVALGFLSLLVFFHFFWQRNLPHRVCASCGSPFRPPMALVSEFPKCNQCVAAQLGKGGVSSAKKDKKRKEMREFMERQSNTATWLDRLLPGLGRAYYHEQGAGFVFIFITSLIIVYGVAIVGAELVVYNAPLTAELAKAHAVYLGGVVLYWLLMNTVFRKDFY